MNKNKSRSEKSKNLRNFVIIVGLISLPFLAWNAIGALQCFSRGGEIRFSSASMTCFMDFSQYISEIGAETELIFVHDSRKCSNKITPMKQAE